MNIFLDDIRSPRDCGLYMQSRIGSKANMYLLQGWRVVRTVQEFTEAIKQHAGKIDRISFDHDLAEEHYRSDLMALEGWEEYHNIDERELTGYDAAVFLKLHYQKENLKLPEVFAHTMNPVGMEKILALFSGK